MERPIKTPNIDDIHDWPNPYEWMANDLCNSIRLAGANYLVALGLFCYSEIVGRHAIRFKNKNSALDPGNKESFEIFMREYMGYGETLDRYPHIWDTYRHGLCHEYFLKLPKDGNGRTGVYLYYSDSADEQQKMQVAGIDLTKGIAISSDGRIRVFVIEPYLEDFIQGLRKLSSEMQTEGWDPERR